jgi:hypothetical protein
LNCRIFAGIAATTKTTRACLHDGWTSIQSNIKWRCLDVRLVRMQA